MAKSVVKTGKAIWDFAKDGGAAGTITPAVNFTLPSGAIILRCIGKEITEIANTATGATIAINCGGVAMKAATAFDDAAFDDVDVHYSTPVTASSTAGVTWVVANTALTAGKYEVYVEYLS